MRTAWRIRNLHFGHEHEDRAVFFVRSSIVQLLSCVGQPEAFSETTIPESDYLGTGGMTKMVRKMTLLKKIALAALAVATIAGSSAVATSSADARPGFRGFHGGYHGGFRGRGFGIGTGIATGFALGGLGYYAYNGYGYGGGCYLERRVFVDRFGYRFVRPVRVCA